MSRKNQILEALSDYDDGVGVSRRELKEAIAELSASGRKRRLQKRLDKAISGQIFSFLFGLILLGSVLVLLFIGGKRYLFQEDANISDSSNIKNTIQDSFSKISSSVFKKQSGANTNNRAIPVLERRLPEGKKYYIQVALCQFPKCSEFFQEMMRNQGYNTKAVPSKASNTTSPTYKEIISVQSMSLEKAQNLAEFINTVNEKSGYANIVSAGDGSHKISLGTFPNPAVAEDLKRYYESLTSAEQVLFTYQIANIESASGLSKILAGPFETKTKVLQAFQDIKSHKNLTNSFITTY